MALTKFHKNIVAFLVIAAALALVTFILVMIHWFDVGKDHLTKNDVRTMMASEYGLPANFVQILNEAGYTDLGDFFTRMGDIFNVLETVDVDEWTTLIENLGDLVNRRVFHYRHTAPEPILNGLHSTVTLPVTSVPGDSMEVEWVGTTWGVGTAVTITAAAQGSPHANIFTGFTGPAGSSWRFVLYIVRIDANTFQMFGRAWTYDTGMNVAPASPYDAMYQAIDPLAITVADGPIEVSLTADSALCLCILSKAQMFVQ